MNERPKTKKKKLGWLLCALLLAVIVGCESIGGLNLNDMLLKQLDVSKQESSQTLELEIDVNKELLAEAEPEAVKLVELLGRLKLDISHAKTDGQGKQWATGTLSFGKGELPFTLHTDAKAVRIDLEGAKRPIVVEIPGLADELGADFGSNAELQGTLMESVRELTKKVASYFVKGLPNPPTISVDRVEEPVRGVATKLTKVHAELNGEQLGKLIPTYAANLIKDKEGFKQTIRDVYAWMSDLPPEIKAAFGAEDLLGAEEASADEVADAIVEELFPELESAQEELAEFSGTDEWKELFDKGVELKTDLYVDDSLHLRKSFAELTIAPAAFSAADSPIRSVKIRSSGEMWNVNGDIDIPDVQVPPTALSAEELDGFTSYRFLRLFEQDSLIYDLLKNDFRIDDQNFELSDEWGIPFLVDDEGVAYVPLRSTLEQFEIKLNVPKNPGDLAFYDPGKNRSIELRKGSKQALVNGEKDILGHELFAEYGYVYIAADDLFDLLGAKYEIVDGYETERLMKVTRDL